MTQDIAKTVLDLKVTANTVLKTAPVQSSELSENQKLSIPVGSYKIKEFEDKGNHLLIQLSSPLGERTEWYIFEGHVDLLTLESYSEHTDQPEPKKEGPIKLPGYSNTFYLSESIVSGGHFSWAEATKNGTRIPESKQIVDNMIAMAHKLEELREFFGGKSISITSWYRDPVTNRKVGGSSKSTHMVGHGVDLNVAGLTPKQVQQKLESYWRAGMGYGKTFTHLDNRNYKARWNYGS